jgi:type IV pilus assembly protein PilW
MRLQQGFSLIELMLAISLGLIVVAAASSLFLTGQRSMALQQGAAEIQNNSQFALASMAKDIRLANLKNSNASMNGSLANAGVVTSSTNLAVANNLQSMSASGASNITDLNSDQLVIQYQPVSTGQYDCEGNLINSTTQYVIERYFVRSDSSLSSESSTALALACDAGRKSDTSISDYGGNGEIIMKRVDYFHVLLITQNSAGALRDMTIAAYRAISSDQPRIVGVKVGILARSTNSVASSNSFSPTTFQVLDQSASLSSNSSSSSNSRYLREVIVQTIALRNALGDRE